MSTRIADARKNIGMTQKALAEKLGIAASTLNGYEKGNHKPDSEILIAVSNITGCTVDYLLGRVDGFNEFFKKENSPRLHQNKTPALAGVFLLLFAFRQLFEDINAIFLN